MHYFVSFTFQKRSGGTAFHNLDLERDKPVTRADRRFIEQAVINTYGPRSELVPGALSILHLQPYDRDDASRHHRYRIRFMRDDGSTGTITVHHLPALSNIARVRRTEQVLERNSAEISMPCIIGFASV